MSLEFEYLLQGISAEHPCGIDFSFSNDFHVIIKAKTQDDPLLDQGEWVYESKQADWQFVHDKTIELLREKTKDIRLYTWLIEAWSHLYGFEGVARGLQLTQQSLERYWLEIHPVIEEHDLDQRLGLLQGFIVQIPRLIKQISLINSAPFYSLGDYEAFRHQRNLQMKQSQDQSSENGAIQSLEHFEQLLLNTEKSILSQNNQYLLDIQTHWQQLKTTLDQLLGLDAPGFAATDSQLESIFTSIRRIYKTDTFIQNPVTSLNPTLTPEPNTSSPIMMNTPSPNMQNFRPQAQSHLANRQQAMRLLEEIAQYFQSHEPHSPVSYMLQKTIKWSQMPLHEWLAQVIKNEHPVEHLHELLGVHANDEFKNEG